VSPAAPGGFWLMPYAGSSSEPALRHFGGSNVLWMDGHVSSVLPATPGDATTMYSAEALPTIYATHNVWDRN
jgi:prepilin-type processing-associated H-X9-DG protein